MKKQVLVLTATLGFAAMALSSYTSGPAHDSGLNRTGAPGNAATCGGGGCHANGSANTVITALTLTDNATSTVVTNGQYTPGHVYTVTLTGTNSSSLAKFGFQMCVENSSNAQAGTLAAMSGTTHVTAVSGISILEHSQALTGTGAGSYSITGTWTAPATGTGNVTFYAMLNAVNGNGSESGDQPALTNKTVALTEAPAAAINNTAVAILKSYPNPVTDALHLQLAKEGNYSATITDATGKTILCQQLLAGGSQSESTISVATLASGVYQLSLSKDGAQQVIRFVKK